MDKTGKPGASTRFAVPLTKVFQKRPAIRFLEKREAFGEFGIWSF